MLPEHRSRVDAILVHAASTAMALAGPGLDAIQHESCTALQMAALQALHASVMAPTRHRAPYLPQALVLFKQVLPCASFMLLLGV